MDDDPADNVDLNFFSNEEEEEDVIFYSQHMISEGDMQDDYEAYFDVWSYYVNNNQNQTTTSDNINLSSAYTILFREQTVNKKEKVIT